MAKKDDQSSISAIAGNIKQLINTLGNTQKATSYATYGIERDLFGSTELLDKISELNKNNKNTLERTVEGNSWANSRINDFGLLSPSENARNLRQKPKEQHGIHDIITNNKQLFSELQQIMMMDNQLYDTIADYEILRRSIPEISRVINLLVNAIIIPEVITSDTFTLEHDIKNKGNVNAVMSRLEERYELASKLRTIVENYLVIGVEYVTVIPYKAVIQAIKSDPDIQNRRKSLLKESTLQESAGITAKLTTDGIGSLNESTFIDDLTNRIKTHLDGEDVVDTDTLKQRLAKVATDHESKEFKDGLGQMNESITKWIDGINVYQSNRKLIYDAAIVESVREDKSKFMFESSFEDFFSDNKNMKIKKKNVDSAAEGMNELDDKTNKAYDQLEINGCKIERLDPARVYPLRIKDTVIAYIYMEERRDKSLRYNLQGEMRNNFSFYRTDNQSYGEYNVKMMEDRMIREIGNRVLANLSPEFLKVNFDDMDVFYEFIRDSNIHRERQDIIILHPDDVIEFKRPDGSILKNATFYAKMYLLMVLNNILTKVRRGSDRTIYYVNTGLTNNVEQSVMNAIEAIQHGEIRVSDLGSIAGIMGSVGSIVDLFLPQTEDGARPVSPEVISGQSVEMDEPFLQFLIKSIILSFNVPSVVVNYTDEVEFARTLSMANLDVATSSALAQGEINKPWQRLVRRIMTYEYDLEKEEVETIFSSLIPSKSMLIQLTSDLIETTKNLAESFANIQLAGKDQLDKLKPLFIKAFMRQNFNYDWATIDAIEESIKSDDIEDKARANALDTAEADAMESDAAGGDADMGDGSGDGGF
jgi:hypothetical protein